MLFTEAAMGSDPARPGRENQDKGLTSWIAGPEGPLVVLAVADGVGGLEGGASASKAAISVVARLFGEQPHLDLERLFREANEAVLAVGAAFPGGSASTLSVVNIEGTTARVATAGDTIAILVRRGKPLAQTTPDIAKGHRSQITRYLGSDSSYAPARIDWSLEAGDTIFVCSDGIWRFVDLDDLSELTRLTSSLAECVAMAIERARDAGSDDDATIAVARIGL